MRLRPVPITVGATVPALFPLALHGWPLWQPLCYARIGDLTVATFITPLRLSPCCTPSSYRTSNSLDGTRAHREPEYDGVRACKAYLSFFFQCKRVILPMELRISRFLNSLASSVPNSPRPMPHLPQCFDFRDGKLWPNERPGLGVEFDPGKLSEVTTVSEYAAPTPIYRRPDGSFTNW
jgi:hypothetical protein